MRGFTKSVMQFMLLLFGVCLISVQSTNAQCDDIFVNAPDLFAENTCFLNEYDVGVLDFNGGDDYELVLTVGSTPGYDPFDLGSSEILLTADFAIGEDTIILVNDGAILAPDQTYYYTYSLWESYPDTPGPCAVASESTGIYLHPAYADMEVSYELICGTEGTGEGVFQITVVGGSGEGFFAPGFSLVSSQEVNGVLEEVFEKDVIDGEVVLTQVTDNTNCLGKFFINETISCDKCASTVLEPIDESYSECGSATVTLAESVPVDEEDIVSFTWNDGTNDVAAGEVTVTHSGDACNGPETTVFTLSVGCGEDASVDLLGGTVSVTVYPADLSAAVAAPNAVGCSAQLVELCPDVVSVIYNSVNTDLTEPGQSATVTYTLNIDGAPDGCSSDGSFDVELPTLATSISGDRCEDDLSISASLSSSTAGDAPVNWFINGEDTGVTGLSFDGSVDAPASCSAATYNLTAAFDCGVGEPIIYDAGSITVYDLPEEGVDFNLPSGGCDWAITTNCDGLAISYTVNGEPFVGEPTALAAGESAMVGFTVSTEGAPESCSASGSYDAACACAVPDVSFSTVCLGDSFEAQVTINTLGSSPTYTITDDLGSPELVVTEVGTYSFGLYPNNTNVMLTVVSEDESCNISSSFLTLDCCVEPEVIVTEACITEEFYELVLEVSSLGSASTVLISDNAGTSTLAITEVGTYNFGTYGNNFIVGVTLTSSTNAACFTTVSGLSLNCTPDCTADPGTIAEGPHYVCFGTDLDIQTEGANLEGNDALVYVLHESETLVDINDALVIDTDGVIALDDFDGTTNTEYTLTAVAFRDLIGDGIPDLLDLCTQTVSTTVVYLDPIIVELKEELCDDENSFTQIVNISGGLPAYDGSEYQLSGAYEGSVPTGDDFPLAGLSAGSTAVNMINIVDDASCIGETINVSKVCNCESEITYTSDSECFYEDGYYEVTFMIMGGNPQDGAYNVTGALNASAEVGEPFVVQVGLGESLNIVFSDGEGPASCSAVYNGPALTCKPDCEEIVITPGESSCNYVDGTYTITYELSGGLVDLGGGFYNANIEGIGLVVVAAGDPLEVTLPFGTAVDMIVDDGFSDDDGIACTTSYNQDAPLCACDPIDIELVAGPTCEEDGTYSTSFNITGGNADTYTVTVGTETIVLSAGESLDLSTPSGEAVGFSVSDGTVCDNDASYAGATVNCSCTNPIILAPSSVCNFETGNYTLTLSISGGNSTSGFYNISGNVDQTLAVGEDLVIDIPFGTPANITVDDGEAVLCESNYSAPAPDCDCNDIVITEVSQSCDFAGGVYLTTLSISGGNPVGGVYSITGSTIQDLVVGEQLVVATAFGAPLNIQVADGSVCPVATYTSAAPNCECNDIVVTEVSQSCDFAGGVYLTTLSISGGNPVNGVYSVTGDVVQNVIAGEQLVIASTFGTPLSIQITDGSVCSAFTYTSAAPNCGCNDIVITEVSQSCDYAGGTYITTLSISGGNPINGVYNISGAAVQTLAVGEQLVVLSLFDNPLFIEVSDGSVCPVTTYSSAAPNCSCTDPISVDAAYACNYNAGTFDAFFTITGGNPQNGVYNVTGATNQTVVAGDQLVVTFPFNSMFQINVDDGGVCSSSYGNGSPICPCNPIQIQEVNTECTSNGTYQTTFVVTGGNADTGVFNISGSSNQQVQSGQAFVVEAASGVPISITASDGTVCPSAAYTVAAPVCGCIDQIIINEVSVDCVNSEYYQVTLAVGSGNPVNGVYYVEGTTNQELPVGQQLVFNVPFGLPYSVSISDGQYCFFGATGGPPSCGCQVPMTITPVGGPSCFYSQGVYNQTFSISGGNPSGSYTVTGSVNQPVPLGENFTVQVPFGDPISLTASDGDLCSVPYFDVAPICDCEQPITITVGEVMCFYEEGYYQHVISLSGGTPDLNGGFYNVINNNSGVSQQVLSGTSFVVQAALNEQVDLFVDDNGVCALGYVGPLPDCAPPPVCEVPIAISYIEHTCFEDNYVALFEISGGDPLSNGGFYNVEINGVPTTVAAGDEIVASVQIGFPTNITANDNAQGTALCTGGIFFPVPDCVTECIEDIAIEPQVTCSDDFATFSVVAIIEGGDPVGGVYQISGTVNMELTAGDVLSFGPVDTGQSFEIYVSDGGLCNGAFVSELIECKPDLPIELSDFYGIPEETGNMLYWTTSTEFDNDRFDLLRSTDGIHFERIASVDALGGDQATDYAYLDKDAGLGITYYRLEDVSNDGAVSKSAIISVTRGSDELNIVSVSPVPATENLQLNFFATQDEPVSVVVYNIMGAELYRANIDADKGLNQVRLDVSSYAAGAYLLSISGNDVSDTQKFIKE